MPLLADHYEDDWTALWWVRADGRGRVLDPGEPEAQHAVALLAARYEQYAATPPGRARPGDRRRALDRLARAMNRRRQRRKRSQSRNSAQPALVR